MIDIKNITKNSGIYKLTNTINGKIYIGKAKSVYARIASHKCAKSNTYIHHAIRKHKWENFEIEILHEFNISVDKFILLALEVAFIDFYNSIDKNIGYNLTLFGSDTTGFKFSEESKLKISNSLKGKRSKENHPLYGIGHTEESRKKMSESQKVLYKNGYVNPNKGNKYSEEKKQKMSKYWKEYFKLNYYKYNWDYAKKPVIQIDPKSDKIIKTWNSAKEAAKALGIHSSGIGHVIKGKNKTAGGFKWKYQNAP